jgi:PPP family 3-phenylpropionic acid transporter
MGGTFGGLVSGYAWEALGSSWTFAISGIFGLLGCLFFIWVMPKKAKL